MRQQGTKDEYRSPHSLDQFIRCTEVSNRAAVDFNIELFVNHRLDAHAAKQLKHGGDIVQVRKVTHFDQIVGQKRSR